MEQNADRAKVSWIPPVYYIFGLCLGLLLNHFIPILPLPCPISGIVGYALIIVSILFAFWAARTMIKAKTTLDVRKPTKRIVKSGPFRISRNPLYLSLLILIAGIGLVMNKFWVLVMLPLIVISVDYAVILREEQYLESKFGNEYLRYKKAVRRWL